ncbi:MAG: type II toxin-antitoxin system VapC family toxin [Alphaproteobacteria bacterium]|nr:type II toxin-antitoxin system VapC family toxin [Alphaproteobacteria bacterium]
MPVVLDASAILALLAGEPDTDIVRVSLPAAIVSAVNVSEVGAKLCDRGMSAPDIRNAMGMLGLEVAAFDEHAAYAAAMLRDPTRKLGLSLGDRACLALAAARKLPVLTTDRKWAGLDIGVEVRLARGTV